MLHDLEAFRFQMQVRGDQIHKCVLGTTDLDIRPYRLKNETSLDLSTSVLIRNEFN